MSVNATIPSLTDTPSQTESDVARSKYLKLIVAALIAAGFLFRALPLLNFGDRLMRQFPTEDGYLMLTVARNMAIGKGMTVHAGEMQTNGIQPLATFLYSGCYLLVSGDKQQGVLVILLVSLLISALAAWVLYQLGSLVLAGLPHARMTAAMAAALWFASPLIVPLSMNCLESGLTLLFSGLSLWLFLAWVPPPTQPQSWSKVLTLGFVFGLTFWARVDAIFLIGALCLTHILLGIQAGGPTLTRRILESAAMGLTSFIVGLPWLISNKIRFGSIMPISGVAQSLSSKFGENFPPLAAKLFEFASIFAGIPSRLETLPITIVIWWSLLVIWVIGIAWVCRNGSPTTRIAGLILAIHGPVLAVYYGLFFGAGYFLGRYLSPLSLLLAVFTAGLFVLVWTRAGKGLSRKGLSLVPAAALLFIVAVNAFSYQSGSQHMHFQVVEWVQANVPDDVWVGAVQTGTLGYFHDRTINLDGKVNPEALAARRLDAVPAYVARSPIEFLVDWIGITGWWDQHPEIKQNFDIVIKDAPQNLGVLRRVDRTQKQPDESAVEPRPQ